MVDVGECEFRLPALQGFVLKAREVVAWRDSEIRVSASTLWHELPGRVGPLLEVTELSAKARAVTALSVCGQLSMHDMDMVRRLYGDGQNLLGGVKDPGPSVEARGSAFLNGQHDISVQSVRLALSQSAGDGQPGFPFLQLELGALNATTGDGVLRAHLEPALYLENYQTAALDTVVDTFSMYLDLSMPERELSVLVNYVFCNFRPDFQSTIWVRNAPPGDPRCVLVRYSTGIETVAEIGAAKTVLPEGGQVETRRNEKVSVSFDGCACSFVPEEIVSSSMISQERVVLAGIDGGRRVLSVCAPFAIINKTTMTLDVYSVPEPGTLSLIGRIDRVCDTPVPHWASLENGLVLTEAGSDLSACAELPCLGLGRVEYRLATSVGVVTCLVTCERGTEDLTARIVVAPLFVVASELPVPLILRVVGIGEVFAVDAESDACFPDPARGARVLRVQLAIAGHFPSHVGDVVGDGAPTSIVLVPEDEGARLVLGAGWDGRRLFVFAPVQFVNETGVGLRFKMGDETRRIGTPCLYGDESLFRAGPAVVLIGRRGE